MSISATPEEELIVQPEKLHEEATTRISVFPAIKLFRVFILYGFQSKAQNNLSCVWGRERERETCIF